jgi:hypothetical protein
MDAAYRKITTKEDHFLADEIRIITFPSVWHAFRAEKILKEAKVPFTLIPVPRELSSSCQGLAAKLDEAVLDEALTLLDSQQVLMEKRGIAINK